MSGPFLLRLCFFRESGLTAKELRDGVDKSAGDAYDCGEEERWQAEDFFVTGSPHCVDDEQRWADADGDCASDASGDSEWAV